MQLLYSLGLNKIWMDHALSLCLPYARSTPCCQGDLPRLPQAHLSYAVHTSLPMLSSSYPVLSTSRSFPMLLSSYPMLSASNRIFPMLSSQNQPHAVNRYCPETHAVLYCWLPSSLPPNTTRGSKPMQDKTFSDAQQAAPDPPRPHLYLCASTFLV